MSLSDVMQVSTLDYHTAGEPLRIVTGGLPEIQGSTMLEKRRYMACELDHFRRLLMLERAQLKAATASTCSGS